MRLGTRLIFLTAALALIPLGAAVARPADPTGGGTVAAADTDGDGISDFVEKKAAYKAAGGSFRHKDIWVECDFMKGLKPSPKMKGYLVAAFKAAPLKNPDGVKGVTLHLDIDDQLPFQKTWGDVLAQGGLRQVYNKLKQTRAAKLDGDKAYYHYCVFVNLISGENVGVSGFSMDSGNFNGGIPGDMFIVALGGPWLDPLNQPAPLPQIQTGTLMHELGHNLNLTHGGDGDAVTKHANYKPNYLSVMNYDFQSGFLGKNGQILKKWDYSTFKAPDLNENSLNEAAGVKAPAAIASKYTFVYRCGNSGFYMEFNKPTTWDCDSNFHETGVKANINNDFNQSSQPMFSVLKSQNNWTHIVWDGGAIAGAGASVASSPPEINELTVPLYRKLRDSLRPAPGGLP